MIKFLYSGNYTIDVPKSRVKSGEPPKPVAPSSALFGSLFDSEAHSLDAATDASSELLIHTAIYFLAEEEDISELKELAKKKYEETLPNMWNSVAFRKSVKMLWDGTPENDRLLWDVATMYAGQKAKQLMDRGEFVSLCKENAEIGFAFSRRLCRRIRSIWSQFIFVRGAAQTLVRAIILTWEGTKKHKVLLLCLL
jgi:hypothetical protein